MYKLNRELQVKKLNCFYQSIWNKPKLNKEISFLGSQAGLFGFISFIFLVAVPPPMCFCCSLSQRDENKIPGRAFISMCNASQAALSVLLLGINAVCHLLHKYFAVADRKWHLWVYHENEFRHPLKWCTGKHSIHFKSMSCGSFFAPADRSINTATISQLFAGKWELLKNVTGL